MAQSGKLKTSEFDAANYVETPADFAGYLELVMEEKADPEELASALNVILRSAGGKSVSLEVFVDMLHAVGLQMRLEPVYATPPYRDRFARWRSREGETPQA